MASRGTVVLADEDGGQVELDPDYFDLEGEGDEDEEEISSQDEKRYAIRIRFCGRPNFDSFASADGCQCELT